LTKALIVVDVQNDFCKGGSLAVSGAEDIIPTINSLTAGRLYDVVVFTQDWHPGNHTSFIGIGPEGKWPIHCVRGTRGAAFHPDLDTRFGDWFVRKGSDFRYDSYSAFADEGGKKTGLAALLYGLGITDVDVCGLATDYCVSYTACDAARANFKTRVLGFASAHIDIGRVAVEMSIWERLGIVYVGER
jgi:nicotinamidase/pyrazinamidase